MRRGRRAIGALVTVGALVVPLVGPAGAAEQKAKNPPGVTDTTVTIGYLYNSTPAATASQVGLSSPQDVQVETIYQQMVDDLNKKGGLLNRQVKVVFGKFDPTQPSWAAVYQKVCTQFTQDPPVWAVYTSAVTAPLAVLTQCLSDAGIILNIDQSAGTQWDQKQWGKWAPEVYGGANLYADRYGNLIALAAKAQPTYFKGAKWGVFYVNNPVTAQIAQKVTKPALEKAGGKVLELAAITPADSTASSNAGAADVTNAVLRLKTAGVDHVFFNTTFTTVNQFMAAARPQEFFPKVFLTTDNFPNTLAASTTIPKTQLAGTIGIGWSPFNDTGDTTGAAAPGGVACINLVKAIGANPAAQPSQHFQRCDSFNFLAAVTKAAKSFDVKKVRAAWNKGVTYDSAMAIEVKSRSGRSDGATKATMVAYDETCGCFKYQGTPKTVGFPNAK